MINISNQERNAAPDIKNKQISKHSKYSYNKWDFSYENPKLKKCDVTFNFEKLVFNDGTNVCSQHNEQYLAVAKDFIEQLIFNPLPSNPKTSTLTKLLTHGLKRILSYMYDNKILKLSDITEFDASCIQSEILNETHKNGLEITNRTLLSRVRGFGHLQKQSHKMRDGLTVHLLEGMSESEWARINANKVIGRQERTTSEMPDSVAKKLYHAAIRDIETYKILHEVNLAREKFISIRKYKKKYRDDGTVYYEPTVKKTFPYSDFGFTNHHEINFFQNRLMSAGYILIALFTGMRIHEILRIRNEHNFKSETLNYNGYEQVISFVISQTTKLEAEPTKYKWQTLPFIKQIMDKLKLGLSNRYTSNKDYLFVQKANRSPYPVSNMSMNTMLRQYLNHNNITYNNEVWYIASHQFRKKFARIMTRQGLGIKAIQDQLKHYDPEMTKIYGDPNIYIELQQEKLILSEELYAELYSNQIPIIGGGADEVKQLRKEFKGMTKAEREIFLQSLPKKALIEQTDDGLCMYRPQKALCGGDKTACRPADCNNSVISADGMRRTLLWRKRENERLLTFFKSSLPKTSYLNSRNIEINKLIEQLDKAEVTNV